MKLVLEILPHADEDMVVHRVIDTFPVTLGRGFDNDIILTDPHVCARHLLIELEQDQWVVTDLESTNGISINTSRRRGHGMAVKSGDRVRIGQTEIRFYSPVHPVAETVPVPKSHPLLGLLAHPLVVWGCLFLSIAIAAGWAYIEIWAEEPGMILATAAAAAAGVIVVWSALWSVAGRMINRRSYFKNHVSVISLYLIAAIGCWYIKVYADFLANENGLADAISYGANTALLACLLYSSLSLASRMTKERRAVSAFLLSAGVMAGVFALNLIATKNFIQQPVYPATLEPYLSGLAPKNSIDQFMQSSEALFNSKTFEHEVKK